MTSNATQIVILTGTGLRHRYVRQFLAAQEHIEMLASFCEEKRSALEQASAEPLSDIQTQHLTARDASEEQYFVDFVNRTNDQSNPVMLATGEINDAAFVQQIIDLNPDLIIAYGCSIIRSQLLERFAGRFINIHLGLSPYYRGAGTNFWALVNGEPEYAGVTFMHVDAGVDTGQIIHQLRARVQPGDTPHDVGNRLIVDMAEEAARLIAQFDQLHPLTILAHEGDVKYYRRKDFSDAATKQLYETFDATVADYVAHHAARDAVVPILTQPALTEQVT